MKLRFKNFIKKYEKQKNMSLEDFIDLDDKIQFNTHEYSLNK